jgi:TonB family protein
MLLQLRLSLFLTLLIFVVNGSADAQNAPAPISLDQQTTSQLAELAERVLAHEHGTACHDKNCIILVANFVGPSGTTSVLGVQLADAISAQLAAKGVQIIDRAKLLSFLQQERIPTKLLDDRATQWLASRLSGTAVLIGHLEREKTGVSLRVQLQNAQHQGKNKVENTALVVQDADRFLAPAEPFGDIPHVETTPQGERIFRAGKDGISMPSCSYRPDPSYSDAGREAKFQGTIVLEVTISPEQRVGDIQIIRGVPFGLNEEARKAVAAWKCKPGLLNGTPVFTHVPIEITFRI